MPALLEALDKIAGFALSRSDTFVEFDINPLFVMREGQGVICGDAVIIPRSR
jgi:hypothetical protein